MGVIANLQQTSVAPAVKRAATSLSSGFIAPAAGGRTADLADRQTAVVGKVESSIARAGSVARRTPPTRSWRRRGSSRRRFQTLSPAEAVLRYAGDFIPSWAGAISIDLMPAVLVLILCVVHAAIRREGLPAVSASNMTAGELVVGDADGARGRGGAADDRAGRGEGRRRKPAADPAAAAADENVTSLPSARLTK